MNNLPFVKFISDYAIDASVFAGVPWEFSENSATREVKALLYNVGVEIIQTITSLGSICTVMQNDGGKIVVTVQGDKESQEIYAQFREKANKGMLPELKFTDLATIDASVFAGVPWEISENSAKREVKAWNNAHNHYFHGEVLVSQTITSINKTYTLTKGEKTSIILLHNDIEGNEMHSLMRKQISKQVDGIVSGTTVVGSGTVTGTVQSKKYEFTGEKKSHDGREVRRIRYIKTGLLGGWIQHESNLSQEGNCRASGNAIVCGSAKVIDNAVVYADTFVCGSAVIKDNAQVYGNAQVYEDAQVSGYSQVAGNARVFGKAQVDGYAIVSGNAQVYGTAHVTGRDKIGNEDRLWEKKGDAKAAIPGILPIQLETSPNSVLLKIKNDVDKIFANSKWEFSYVLDALAKNPATYEATRKALVWLNEENRFTDTGHHPHRGCWGEVFVVQTIRMDNVFSHHFVKTENSKYSGGGGGIYVVADSKSANEMLKKLQVVNAKITEFSVQCCKELLAINDKPAKKYEFTGDTKIVNGHTVRRIKYADGIVGGWIEKESNLSHEGNCRVSGDSCVYGNAQVLDDAVASGTVQVFDEAKICNNAIAANQALVHGKAQVHGKAKVYGNARVFGNAQLFDDVQIFEYAIACGGIILIGKNKICGTTVVE